MEHSGIDVGKGISLVPLHMKLDFGWVTNYYVEKRPSDLWNICISGKKFQNLMNVASLIRLHNLKVVLHCTLQVRSYHLIHFDFSNFSNIRDQPLLFLRIPSKYFFSRGCDNFLVPFSYFIFSLLYFASLMLLIRYLLIPNQSHYR